MRTTPSPTIPTGGMMRGEMSRSGTADRWRKEDYPAGQKPATVKAFARQINAGRLGGPWPEPDNSSRALAGARANPGHANRSTAGREV